ncbi:MAG: SDR family oxidoreductase [Elusimicrobia bacterium]|nr:SDR family oxidoreductase [Elusimicrobiota bacterium]
MRTREKAAFGLGVGAGFLYMYGRRWPWEDFRGRVVLITGGTRGLGLNLAREFAARGAKLAVCARDPREVDAARWELERRGAEVYAAACDIGDGGRARALVREVEARLGSIDVLVNNAGVIMVGPHENQEIADYEEAMRVHFWGPLHLILAVVDGMKRRRSGRIVNIASIGGKFSMPHLVPYGASKFALVGLSEGLAAELSRYGVYVTTVCPGLTRTGSFLNASFKGRHGAEYTWFSLLHGVPLLSMDARRAARLIVEACRKGEPELILTPLGKLGAAIQGLLPKTMSRLLSALNTFLPGPGPAGGGRRAGRDSETRLTRSFLLRGVRRAAAINNE